MTPFVVAALGPASVAYRRSWSAVVPDLEIYDSPGAAAGGLRAGSRVLGIGIDSLRLALTLRRSRVRRISVATNPWPAAAASIAGIPVDAVLGLYAEPGTRSWRVLRRYLSDSLLLSTSRGEAVAWERQGGRAIFVPLGATFDEPVAVDKPTGPVQIFCGGTSDRDTDSINRLCSEVLASAEDVRLTIVGAAPQAAPVGERISVLPWASRQEFHERLAQAHAHVLPLRRTNRAAGHMVLLAAAQFGVPTLATPVPALDGYESLYVQQQPEGSTLQQLLQIAGDRQAGEKARSHWAEEFSLSAYLRRVALALQT